MSVNINGRSYLSKRDLALWFCIPMALVTSGLCGAAVASGLWFLAGFSGAGAVANWLIAASQWPADPK